jgi:hypothetical protein
VSEHFEEVKTRILLDSADNGGPSTRDLVDLIAASHADNAAEHITIVASLDVHIAKLEEMEERSLDIASSFAAVMGTPQFQSLMRDRDRKMDAAVAEHVSVYHLTDEEAVDMRKAWRTVKWALIVIGSGVLVALADQIGHLIFGGAT